MSDSPDVKEAVKTPYKIPPASERVPTVAVNPTAMASRAALVTWLRKDRHAEPHDAKAYRLAIANEIEACGELER